MKTLTEKDIYIFMFIVALFAIANIWKQPKCSLMDEYVLLSNKGKEILPFATPWMDLEALC